MTKLSGALGFENYYKVLWGERWPALRGALLKPELQVLRWNSWVTPTDISSSGESEGKASDGGLSFSLPGCTLRLAEFSEPRRHEGGPGTGLLDSYVMDPASVMATRHLPVKNGDQVLDLCAAPGGKTLILAEALVTAGELTANELSSGRRERLIKVIQNYIPRSVRERIWVKGQDGSRWGLNHPEAYDAILVDAPCSGERHLLANDKELQMWSPKRGQGLAHRQYALLCSALMAAKPGGFFLYSTCSINRAENEEVVKKLLKKKTGFRICPLTTKSGLDPEPLEVGAIYLPDRCGFGPLYFCLFQKEA